MQQQDRRAAVAAYKERKPAAGIYVVRCAAGGVWVGQSQSLDTVQNRIWFALRMGSSPCRSLQAAWQTHGADSFRFEILERLAEEETDYIRNAQLKARLAHWRAALGAQTV